MKVTLIRPDPGNERFGLGPFFRVEPLGLEYVAAAFEERGAEVTIVDGRYDNARTAARKSRARLFGISCMHALEYDRTLDLAREIRRRSPDAFVVIGGHAAAAYPGPLEVSEIDAICVGDGEAVVPGLLEAVGGRRAIETVPDLRIRTRDGWVDTQPTMQPIDLDRVPLPARVPVRPYRHKYHCLLFKPVWLVETARGCPFRCSFCSVWSLYDRSFRERSIEWVVKDMERVGEHVFIVDDLFWGQAERSLALARELRARGVRKRWILVQTRTDVVERHPELLEAWRPIAQDFDIFFGFESPSDAGLDRLTKDATLAQTVEASRIARSQGYGVTGNFVVDPDWGRQEFEELWDFVAAHRFERAGYTILTPLPGTQLYREKAEQLDNPPWFKFDMHHALWEPRLGPERFFDLYAETWRRSILNLGGKKRWRDWAVQVRASQLLYLTRVLIRTQRMMRSSAYLSEHGAALPLKNGGPTGAAERVPQPDRSPGSTCYDAASHGRDAAQEGPQGSSREATSDSRVGSVHYRG